MHGKNINDKNLPPELTSSKANTKAIDRQTDRWTDRQTDGTNRQTVIL